MMVGRGAPDAAALSLQVPMLAEGTSRRASLPSRPLQALIGEGDTTRRMLDSLSPAVTLVSAQCTALSAQRTWLTAHGSRFNTQCSVTSWADGCRVGIPTERQVVVVSG